MSASKEQIKAAYEAAKTEWFLIDGTIKRILSGGVTTASLSSAGGSKSYTNLDLPMLYVKRKEIGRTLSGLRRAYQGCRGAAITHRMVVRS